MLQTGFLIRCLLLVGTACDFLDCIAYPHTRRTVVLVTRRGEETRRTERPDKEVYLKKFDASEFLGLSLRRKSTAPQTLLRYRGVKTKTLLLTSLEAVASFFFRLLSGWSGVQLLESGGRAWTRHPA